MPRFFDHPAGSYFLFGPRGTGKSTWLRHRYPDAAWIDLLDAEAERHYYTRPERLKEFIAAHAGRRTIVIDEIQRVPQLLPLVHQHLESDKSTRFVLTGSSARKLCRSAVDLLAGRAVLCAMHPFMAAELGGAFDLARSLESGLVPLVVMAENPDRTLRGYIDLYLQQEVKAEGLVRRRAKRVVVAHAKLYFFDSGLFRSLRPVGPLDAREEIAGPALEGLVLQHLRSWISYGGADCRVHFWRTRGGSEVGFVLYGGAGFYTIEVKNSRSLRPSDLRGLRTFHQDYPESSPLLLYRGDEALVRNGVRCLPVERFLRELIPGRDLPY